MKYPILKVILILISFISTAFAVPVQNVPFQNQVLSVNGAMIANYTFGSNNMIFCYSNQENNSGGTANISWSYRGQTKQGTLPIVLINNSTFQGELADGSGSMTIQNTLSTPSVINCVYGF